MRGHFCALAAYNIWANERIYAAVGELGDDEYRRDTGAFFTSIHGTLNHILVADRIWMRRFTGEGSSPAHLNAIIHEDFDSLREARSSEDQRISDYIESLGDTAFEGQFTYTTATNMRTITQRLAPALTHLFNHQTHHRGQTHGILSQLGKTPPSLDLIHFFREPEGREFA